MRGFVIPPDASRASVDCRQAVPHRVLVFPLGDPSRLRGEVENCNPTPSKCSLLNTHVHTHTQTHSNSPQEKLETECAAPSQQLWCFVASKRDPATL